MTARHCYRCARELSVYEPKFCGGCGAPIPTLFSAHASAGVTTLAMATGFHDNDEPVEASRHPRVIRLLTARTHAAGFAQLRNVLDAGRQSYTRVLLIPDARGKLPKPLRDQALIISGVIPVSFAPWVESWRYAPGVEISSVVTKFCQSLSAELTEQTP